MGRVLGVLRLSREREESTSIVRQRTYIEQWAEQNGHTVIGYAEDVDVSGSVAPWERPDLGCWLPVSIGGTADEAGFDILCAWRLDRISRRVLHLSTLIDWCKRSGKTIISTSEGFDITSPMGAVFVNILAALAEGELEAIRARARSSFEHLMKQGRWRGGFVPYGYRAVKATDGDGWKLEIAPETEAVLKEVLRRIVDDGDSANSVVRWLNESAIPSPLDAQRKRSGKKTSGTEWRVGNLLKMLRSHALLGYAEMTETRTRPDGTKESFTRLVLDKEGMPLQRAEPIISQRTWDRLQQRLRDNSNPKAGNRTGGSPLLRVAYCECGEPMYRNRGRNGMYYRCGLRARAGRTCPVGLNSIRADELESSVEGSFLALVGGLEVMRRVFVPGDDIADRIGKIESRLRELRADRDAGLYEGEDAEYQERFLDLKGKLTDLKAQPSRSDRWELESTGETYAERWAALTDPADRASELRSAGVRAVVHAEPIRTRSLFPDGPVREGGRVSVGIPHDLQQRVLAHAQGA